MKITPIEVEQHPFERVFRGFNCEEVQSFLNLVARELEDQVRENNALQEEIRKRDLSLNEYQQNERQLREVLVSAGRITEEMRESARKEADLIRAEAEQQAQRIVQASQDQVVALEQQIQDLRRQKARLMSELSAVLDSHRRLLETQAEIDKEAEQERKAALQAQSAQRSKASGHISSNAGSPAPLLKSQSTHPELPPSPPQSALQSSSLFQRLQP